MSDERDLGNSIGAFLVHMTANGRQGSSIRCYARELSALRQYLCGRALREIAISDVSRFLASPGTRLRRDGREKAPATLNRTRAVVRAFFTWCEGTSRIERSPAFLVKVSPCTPPVRYMTTCEVRHFLGTIRRSPHRLARRDYALFSTIAYTGLRLSEATRARWGDLDLHRRRLLVPAAKGGRAESRCIPRHLLQILVNFRGRVAEALHRAESPLFCSKLRNPVSPRCVQYRFAFWLSQSGIRRRFSVHSLRHTFATSLYRATGDLLLVNRALGHRDIRSTQRYAHVEDRRLVRALNRLFTG